MKIQLILFVCFGSLLASGCAHIQETAKVIWGSSTKALEEARDQAVTATFGCDYDEGFDTVLRMDRDQTIAENRLPAQKVFDVFMKDRRQGVIVVMGINGNVNTTKVGIFFERVGVRSTRVEISSLSSTAKEKVAKAVFQELSLRFSQQPKAEGS